MRIKTKRVTRPNRIKTPSSAGFSRKPLAISKCGNRKSKVAVLKSTAPNMLVSSVHAGQRSSISFPNGRVERHGSQADGSTCRISICRERPRRSASLRKNRQCGLAPTANGHNGARHKTARALTRGNRTLDPNGPTGYVGSHRCSAAVYRLYK